MTPEQTVVLLTEMGKDKGCGFGREEGPMQSMKLYDILMGMVCSPEDVLPLILGDTGARDINLEAWAPLTFKGEKGRGCLQGCLGRAFSEVGRTEDWGISEKR